MEGTEGVEKGRLGLLQAIDQSLKEERERQNGVWTKVYEGLSPADQENLLRSVNNLLDQFVTHYPNELPDIVILPELSARPLFELLDPALQAIADKRQIKAPSFVYFQTHKVPEFALIDDEGRDKQFTPAKDIRKLLQTDASADPSLQNFLQTEIEIRERGPEKARKLRGLMKSRAEEIVADAQISGIAAPTMVIFDDYVTKQHSSLDEVRRAFGTSIPAYCLLQERGVSFPANLQVFTGMQDPYGTTEINNSQGFEYRSKNAGNRHAIGYEKDENSKYTKLSEARNETSMQNLKTGMRAIGQKIATRLAA